MASEDERVALADDRARTNGGGVGQVNSSGEKTSSRAYRTPVWFCLAAGRDKRPSRFGSVFCLQHALARGTHRVSRACSRNPECNVGQILYSFSG
jgi:hypothetical protein